MKKIFTLLSLLLLMVAYQSSFAQCTVTGAAYNGFNTISTVTGATIDDNTNIYTYNAQNGSNFTWRYDLVVVAPNIAAYEYLIKSSYRNYCGYYGCTYTDASDIITILRYSTNEVLATSTIGGQITFKPLPNDTIRILFKASGCNDNIRSGSFYGNRITISVPTLSTPYKPIINVSGVTTSTSPVVFSWNAVPGADSYCIRIYKDRALTQLVTSVCGINQTTYTWTPGSNKRTEQVTVDSIFYQVSGENTVGQGEWSDVSRVDVETAITGIDASSEYGTSASIVPNPNQGNFTLVLKGAEASDYKVLDNAGKIVTSGVLSKGENSLSAGLNPGIYYLVTPQKVQKIVVY